MQREAVSSGTWPTGLPKMSTPISKVKWRILHGLLKPEPYRRDAVFQSQRFFFVLADEYSDWHVVLPFQKHLIAVSIKPAPVQTTAYAKNGWNWFKIALL